MPREESEKGDPAPCRTNTRETHRRTRFQEDPRNTDAVLTERENEALLFFAAHSHRRDPRFQAFGSRR